jgi:ATP-dependent exoDNAse (exonuclease V) beta subunit
MPHISYSALKNWDFCPYYHKLTYLDKVKLFQGNVYTAFGTALHTTCEKLTLNETKDYKNTFSKEFENEINNLKELSDNDQSLINEMKTQGVELASMILQCLDLKFPSYEVVSAEEQLFQPIKDIDVDYDYKGFLDLVIKTPDGKYHIIDWKSCSNIDPKMVETYFGLLKRTAKKDKVEFYRVSSGPRKVKNALNILNKAVYNIHKNNHPKNRLNCAKCEFNKTQWCS